MEVLLVKELKVYGTPKMTWGVIQNGKRRDITMMEDAHGLRLCPHIDGKITKGRYHVSTDDILKMCSLRIKKVVPLRKAKGIVIPLPRTTPCA